MSHHTTHRALHLTSRTLGLLITVTAQALTLYLSANLDSGSGHAAVTIIGIAAALIANASEIATLTSNGRTRPYASLVADSAAWICLSVGAALELGSINSMRGRMARISANNYHFDGDLVDPVVNGAVWVYFILAGMHFVMSVFGFVKLARSEGDNKASKSKDFEDSYA